MKRLAIQPAHKCIVLLDQILEKIFCGPDLEIPDWAAALALAVTFLLAGFGGHL